MRELLVVTQKRKGIEGLSKQKESMVTSNIQILREYNEVLGDCWKCSRGSQIRAPTFDLRVSLTLESDFFHLLRQELSNEGPQIYSSRH